MTARRLPKANDKMIYSVISVVGDGVVPDAGDEPVVTRLGPFQLSKAIRPSKAATTITARTIKALLLDLLSTSSLRSFCILSAIGCSFPNSADARNLISDYVV